MCSRAEALLSGGIFR
jgi:hypothetical protein